MNTTFIGPEERGWRLTRTSRDLPVISGMNREDALELWGASLEGFAAADPMWADTDRTAFLLDGAVEGTPSAWTSRGPVSWPVSFPRLADGVYAHSWPERDDSYTLYFTVEGGEITGGLTTSGGQVRSLSTVWAKPGAARGYKLLVAALQDQTTPLAPDTIMSEGACHVWRKAAQEAAAGTTAAGVEAAFDMALLPKEVQPVLRAELEPSSREGLAELNSFCFGERFSWALDDEQGRFLTTDGTDCAELRAEFGWSQVPNRS